MKRSYPKHVVSTHLATRGNGGSALESTVSFPAQMMQRYFPAQATAFAPLYITTHVNSDWSITTWATLQCMCVTEPITGFVVTPELTVYQQASVFYARMKGFRHRKNTFKKS